MSANKTILRGAFARCNDLVLNDLLATFRAGMIGGRIWLYEFEHYAVRAGLVRAEIKRRGRYRPGINKLAA